VFLPKYLETQFSLSKSEANLLTGGTAIPGACIGILFGGYILKRLQLRHHTRLLCFLFSPSKIVDLDQFGKNLLKLSHVLTCFASPQTKYCHDVIFIKRGLGSDPVSRIHDILVWFRIRIRGSMPLTNGSGSGSFYFHQ
jgi:hypothetical protein